MSKRLGQFHLKQPLASKKPRLDIEIIPSQQYNPQPTTSNGNRKPNAVANNAAKMDALWGDEDDEFIVLASQAVEEMSQQSQAFNGSSMADITFRKFSRNVQSSTQAVSRTSGVSKPPTLATDKQVAELFADGEDDIFTEKFDDNYENIDNKLDNYFDNEFDEDFNLNEFRQEGQKPLVDGRIEPIHPPPQTEFKVPALVARASTSTTVTQSVSVVKATVGVSVFKPKTPSAATQSTSFSLDSVKDAQAAKDNAAKKQEHAKDIQVKFLTKRLEQCEKKAESMQRDYNEALEKAKIKDGEVAMLRYELKTVKGTNEHLRMEKIRETETIQKEWVEKHKELEKAIAAQKSELNFKELELMNLRSKRLNHTKRSIDVRENHTEPRTEHQRVTDQSFVLCNLFPGMSVSEEAEPLILDPHIFAVSLESVAQYGGQRKYSHFTRTDKVLAHKLVTLQTCLSQIMSQVGGTSSMQLSAQMLPLVAKTSEEALAEITQYCQSLAPAAAKDKELNNLPHSVGRMAGCLGQGGRPKSRMDLNGSTNIFQQDQLFPGEQVRVVRRFLAVLGLFCRISNTLVDETLLKHNRVQQLARDIKHVSNTSALHAHHGMVTGAAALLKGISFHLHRLTPLADGGTQLIGLFRSIVLCQNDAPSALVELSEFLRRVSARTDNADVVALLNQLCRSHHHATHGGRLQLKEKYRMKTISFSEETCTLQMYASLMESSVRQHEPYGEWQLKLLLVNADNTICFLRNVLVPSPVGWVKNFIVDRSSRGCNLCHIRMVSAFLVLLHRVLQCWHQRTFVNEGDIDKLHSIARNGTLLLYDLFGTAYCSKLLLLGGDTVKYRLRIIYDWLKMHQESFHFQAVHIKALERLDLGLLMNDPLKSNHEAEEMKMETEASTTGESSEGNDRADFGKKLYVDFFKNKYCLLG